MKTRFSIVLQANKNLTYPLSDFSKMLNSIYRQYNQSFDVVVYGDMQEIKKLEKDYDFTFVFTKEIKTKALNAALRKCKGEYVIICDNQTSWIEFKKSALTLYRYTMKRHPNCVLLYSDYNIVDNNNIVERRLLEFHPGRVTETWDMGFCLLYRHSFLKKLDYCDEKYSYHPLYDIRLKAFETEQIVHISNRFSGEPYTAHTSKKNFDVFAYLKVNKDISLELEDIFTSHLKRINAYLKPGQNYHRAQYSLSEQEQFKNCLVSVVIPVFDRPEFIGHAIESVLDQTVQNIECIVVCNGGENDPTVSQVRRYMKGGDKFDANKPAVKLIVHDINNLGLCFNDALHNSTAKYYMQLDSDDLLFPKAIEKLLKEYDKDDRIGMVIGSYQVYEKDDHGDVNPVLIDGNPFIVTHEEWTEENGRNNLLRIGGAGAPRSIKIKVLKDVGWFGMNDSPYCRNYAEDYELVNKVAEKYRIGRVYEPVYKVVRHSGGTDHMIDQMTINVNDNAKDDMRLKAIKRRQLLNTVKNEKS
jgi:glycosyltransferase involved in cell wall biosynthesis